MSCTGLLFVYCVFGVALKQDQLTGQIIEQQIDSCSRVEMVLDSIMEILMCMFYSKMKPIFVDINIIIGWNTK